jgi:hypothetical protein
MQKPCVSVASRSWVQASPDAHCFPPFVHARPIPIEFAVTPRHESASGSFASLPEPSETGASEVLEASEPPLPPVAPVPPVAPAPAVPPVPPVAGALLSDEEQEKPALHAWSAITSCQA